jgi:hypothetical protein
MEENMYNLFYVESPLQMLSAISAFNRFNQHKAILIVNVSHGDRINNDTQLLQLIGDEWDEVFIQRQRKGKVRILTGLLRDIIKFSLKYRGEINKFFFGEYRSVDMAILNRFLSPKESILLDDGSFTITAQNYYIKNKILPYSEAKKYKVFKPFLKNLKIPNLYSFFKLDSTLLKGQVNYYEFSIKKKIDIKEGHIYFFGTKFSESKNMLLTDEINVLSKVLKKYAGYKVFYIPHRDESLNKLDDISKLGYQVKNLGKPAETYFDETDAMPELVLSYYSTVLYTCYLRFDNVQLHSIDITNFLLQESAKINAKEIYDYYKTVGIPLIVI